MIVSEYKKEVSSTEITGESQASAATKSIVTAWFLLFAV